MHVVRGVGLGEVDVSEGTETNSILYSYNRGSLGAARLSLVIARSAPMSRRHRPYPSSLTTSSTSARARFFLFFFLLSFWSFYDLFDHRFSRPLPISLSYDSTE